MAIESHKFTTTDKTNTNKKHVNAYMCVMMLAVDVVVTAPEKDKVDAILQMHGMSRNDLKCSICGEDLSDLKHLRAIFPYKSALVCCDKFECLSACRDKLIGKDSV